MSRNCDGPNPEALQESCWEPWNNDLESLGHSSPIMWLKFRLENTDAQTKSLVFNHQVIATEKVTLFEKSSDSWTKRDEGRAYPNTQLDVFFPTFNVELPSGGKDYYLRFDGAPRITLAIKQKAQFYKGQNQKLIVTMLGFGALLAIALFELIIFTGTGKAINITLAFGALSTILKTLVLDGVYRIGGEGLFNHISLQKLFLLPTICFLFEPMFLYFYSLQANKNQRTKNFSLGLMVLVAVSFFSLVLLTVFGARLTPLEVMQENSYYWFGFRTVVGLSTLVALIQTILMGIPRDRSHYLIILGVTLPIVFNVLMFVALQGRVDLIVNNYLSTFAILVPIFCFLLATSLESKIRENRHIEQIVSLNNDLNENLVEMEEKAKERAEKIVQLEKKGALGEMAGGVAHEINSPLSTIHAIAKRLRKLHKLGKLSESDLERYSEKIERNSDRIFSITSGLKFFSDKSHRSLKVTDLAALMAKVAYYANQRFKSTSYKVRLAVGSDCYILCDENYMTQIIHNLVERSIIDGLDLTEKWVKISLSKEEGSIVLIYTDSSGYISGDIKRFIETPFDSEGRESVGWGLKLSIIRELIAQQKGEIQVGSDPKVAKYILTFPIAEHQEVA